MIITTHQPIFLPWPGFFFKAMNADAMVLLDKVQFPQGRGWMTRNRLKSPQGELWLRIPVHRKGRGRQSIAEVELVKGEDWPSKHLESIRQHYANAPYLGEYFPPIEAIYGHQYRHLFELNLDLIRLLWDGLGLKTRLLFQSELQVDGTGTDLLVSVCRALDADVHVSLSPARKYIDMKRFQSANLDARFLSYRPQLYPQLWGWGIYNLSVLDLLLNCGPKSSEVVRAGNPHVAPRTDY